MRGAGLLETRWLYVAPCGFASGREGVDYVVDEAGIMVFVQATQDSQSSNASNTRSPVQHTQASSSAYEASASDLATS